jgi:hypothetical protein
MKRRAVTLFEFPAMGLCGLITAVAACSSPTSSPVPAKSLEMGASTDGSAGGGGHLGAKDGTRVADAGANCTPERTTTDGKFSAADAARWGATTGPVEVMILVKCGAVIGPLPTCPDRDVPCAAADALTNTWSEENLESQKCVRQLIVATGGAPHGEVIWLVDDFVADLTWEQIQIVATHPDVISIESNIAMMGPPGMDGGPT